MAIWLPYLINHLEFIKSDTKFLISDLENIINILVAYSYITLYFVVAMLDPPPWIWLFEIHIHNQRPKKPIDTKSYQEIPSGSKFVQFFSRGFLECQIWSQNFCFSKIHAAGYFFFISLSPFLIHDLEFSKFRNF